MEHWFQAQKFPGTDHEEAIRTAPTPGEAKALGRTRKLTLRGDWEQVKDDMMRRGVLAKFQVHREPREVLLSTGDEPIVEDAPGDYYWGQGADGSGKNMLGKILVEVRAHLREHPVVEQPRP